MAFKEEEGYTSLSARRLGLPLWLVILPAAFRPGDRDERLCETGARRRNETGEEPPRNGISNGEKGAPLYSYRCLHHRLKVFEAIFGRLEWVSRLWN